MARRDPSLDNHARGVAARGRGVIIFDRGNLATASPLLQRELALSTPLVLFRPSSGRMRPCSPSQLLAQRFDVRYVLAAVSLCGLATMLTVWRRASRVLILRVLLASRERRYPSRSCARGPSTSAPSRSSPSVSLGPTCGLARGSSCAVAGAPLGVVRCRSRGCPWRAAPARTTPVPQPPIRRLSLLLRRYFGELGHFCGSPLSQLTGCRCAGQGTVSLAAARCLRLRAASARRRRWLRRCRAHRAVVSWTALSSACGWPCLALWRWRRSLSVILLLWPAFFSWQGAARLVTRRSGRGSGLAVTLRQQAGVLAPGLPDLPSIGAGTSSGLRDFSSVRSRGVGLRIRDSAGLTGGLAGPSGGSDPTALAPVFV